jgi:phosphate transport system permease protein
MVVTDRGQIHTIAIGQTQADTQTDTLPLNGAKLTAGAKDIEARLFALGDDRGRVHIFGLNWRVDYEDNRRSVQPEWHLRRTLPAFNPPQPIDLLAVALDDDGGERVVAGDRNGRLVSLYYDAEWDELTRADLPPAWGPSPGPRVLALDLNSDGERLLLGLADGRIGVYDLGEPDEPEIIQITAAADTAITACRFLLGGVSAIVGDATGGLSRWLPVLGSGASRRAYRRIDEFDTHASAVTEIVASRRGKSFISVDRDGSWHLSHATANRTYLKVATTGEPLERITMTPKADGVLAMTASGRTILWGLDDPHPEATLKTLFGRVWYEGYDQPEFVWQSTGGTDEFEPKLSLIPLIFGTIKGTLYAMLFSIPVALLAAIYVSQLARPGFRATVKPTIELMAAIPSVVVGFLAALWLAPLIEQHLVAVGLILLSVPLFAILAAVTWNAVPPSIRERTPRGLEPAIALPFILLGAWLALQVAPQMEVWLFGGDVRQWLFAEQGIRFDPRNNIVVGFALGIAVIPIIFTVSEDALSNVPSSLVAGALALGASRWQATWRIVLRAASPGIFAAIMLGFGRAVGETMIVLMATGNTPIMDWSIFNGMRTMSAAIAVEIPEAPQGGTLYRVLFLTAFLLFTLTLLVNTVATFVGTRLRRRYGRF